MKFEMYKMYLGAMKSLQEQDEKSNPHRYTATEPLPNSRIARFPSWWKNISFASFIFITFIFSNIFFRKI